MTQEEKQLLLQDLCARLPYDVICTWENDGYNGGGKLIDVCKVKTSTGFVYWDCYFEDENDDIPIEIVKPYLRPMSSMTEEEKKEFNSLINGVEERCINAYGKGGYTLAFTEVNDWLNKHHFDYRGLIPKGLALEAPEGMYKNI